MEHTTPTGIRLNKYISDTGYTSRREADKLIESGKVTLNGKRAELGTRVQPGDKVCVNGQPIGNKSEPVYIAFNKPVGIICTTEEHIKGNIITYINHPDRIFPIGRLDKESDGLILLTNDGDIVNKILRAGNNHEKEYVVTVHKNIDEDFLKRMARGVHILDTVTKPCKIVKEGNKTFRIWLTQGLNRQIRRMCEALGYEVLKLKRERIMHITLEGIAPGKWRNLTAAELKELHRLTEKSAKTAE